MMVTRRVFLLGILVGVLLTVAAGYARYQVLRIDNIENFLAQVASSR